MKTTISNWRRSVPRAARTGGTPVSRLGLLAVLVAGAGVLSTGCAPNRAPAARFVQQADRLHEQALASAITPDDELQEYVQQIGKRLEEAAQAEAPDKARGPFFRNMRFHLVDSPIVNAITTGGAHVYVYRGLFDFCRTEEELAAAVAHAYAHALNLDFERTEMRPPEDPRPVRQVVWDYVVYRFNEQQEDESDQLAFRLYARAGWDPAMFENLFVRLSDEYPQPPAPGRAPLAERGSLARGMTAGIPRKWRQLPVADARTYDALRKQANGLRVASGSTNEAHLYLLAFPNCILSGDLEVQRKAQDMLRPPPAPAVQVEPN